MSFANGIKKTRVAKGKVIVKKLKADEVADLEVQFDELSDNELEELDKKMIASAEDDHITIKPPKKTKGKGKPRAKKREVSDDNKDSNSDNSDINSDLDSDINSDLDNDIDNSDVNDTRNSRVDDNDVDDVDDVDNVDNADNIDNVNNDSDEITEKKTRARKSTAKPKARAKKAPAKQSTEKKGPGRPRKMPKKEPIPKKGISATPINSDNHIEFVYDQPLFMKKIFSFLKALGANQAQFIFRPTEIIIYAINHVESTEIRIKIDVSKINQYYCRSSIDIGLSVIDMEKLFKKVDKDYRSLVIMAEQESKNRSITMIFENEMQIEEIHVIELIQHHNKIQPEKELMFLDESYMITFNLLSKYFKKTVNDIKSMSTNVVAFSQSDTNSPLVIEYSNESNKIKSRHTMRNNSKMSLTSRLQDEDDFRIEVNVNYMIELAKAQISDDITILLDEQRPFMTKVIVDNNCIEIKTLTKIVDLREEDADE